jgi:competence protein ComFB
MAYVNAMERIVEDLFTELIHTKKLPCECPQCKLDIMLITLNHLPPKYVASHEGEVYVKALYLNQQIKMDVLSELSRAANKVAANPHHHA